MKLVFEAGSLHSMYDQLQEAMDTIQYGMVGRPKDVKADHNKVEEVSFDQPPMGNFPWGQAVPQMPMKTTGVEAAPVITNAFSGVDWAKPDTDKTVKQEQRVDGYVVSDGKVWVPVEGRPSAYTGVEVEEYHRRKAAAGELDSEGQPWNEAIHSSTKSKTTKGVWKKKKQFGDKAESSTAAVQSQPVSPLVATTQAQTPGYDQGPVATGQAPEMHNFDSFKKNLQMILVRLVNSGKITREYMGQLNQHFQVTNLWDIASDDGKSKSLFDLFVQYQFIIGV